MHKSRRFRSTSTVSPKTATMCSCSRRPSVRASLLVLRDTLSATIRSSDPCRARNTLPKPPRPSSGSTAGRGDEAHQHGRLPLPDLLDENLHGAQAPPPLGAGQPLDALIALGHVLPPADMTLLETHLSGLLPQALQFLPEALP